MAPDEWRQRLASGADLHASERYDGEQPYSDLNICCQFEVDTASNRQPVLSRCCHCTDEFINIFLFHLWDQNKTDCICEMYCAPSVPLYIFFGGCDSITVRPWLQALIDRKQLARPTPTTVTRCGCLVRSVMERVSEAGLNIARLSCPRVVALKEED